MPEIWADLVSWAQATHPDTFVHPDLTLQDRRLVTRQPIPKDTCILVLPVVRTEDTTAAPQYGCTGADIALAQYLLKYKETTLAAYWRSLPKNYQFLPRHWPDTGILDPTSIGPAVAKQRQHTIPEELDAALTMVSSRAFDCGDSAVGMVPLLDLANHTRRPNVRYRIERGLCHVTTATTVLDGEVSITYGAQSNTNLLVYYGFCLRHNLEPDGSSNDTLQLDGVLLRTGPKSYTYGPLVRLLECTETTIRGTADTTMRDFLDWEAAMDDDDDKDDDDDWNMDVMYGKATQSDTKDAKDDDDGDDEITRVRQAQERLQSTLEGYPNAGDNNNNNNNEYVNMLVQSERRTLSFFLSAVLAIAARLQDREAPETDTRFCYNAEDGTRLREQVQELVDVYFSIRELG